MAFPSYTKTFHTTSYPSIDPSLPHVSTAGKVVLITGGGSGIGSRIAHAFATSGATKIAILGRTVSSLEQTKQGIYDEVAVNKAFEGVSKAFGEIDILISNAGYLPDTKPMAEADVEEWFKGMTMNVKGTLILSKVFLKYASKNPTFVHVSTSGCHIAPMPKNSAYAVSKMAAARMMEYFAFENPHVRVHTIHPGVIRTDMHKKSSEGGIDLDFPFDDIELPASFAVWIVSPEADFLRSKFVWSNWDVEELKSLKEQLLSSQDLTLGLQGWP
ncbi:hypothetical protein FVEN_g9478 [Fusarium venenatum]|uniref:NAD(P)-binding protein n=1 Tax=Fusarium venenatum TaxID=56646 RepID=A0A2L2TCI7_9HYPO|nr:uncharacterized protein FVRRES_04171 [Fusarium venenatum]KAG8352413.1 hypothetical protein FVEN_g9478 [Fusarium venenatum]CEI67659.1 unnamed protein product [Fusarium venenatum]